MSDFCEIFWDASLSQNIGQSAVKCECCASSGDSVTIACEILRSVDSMRNK